MRKVEQCSDEMKIVEKNLDDIWEEMRWDEMRWQEVRWDEVRLGEKSSDEMRWDEMWSVYNAVGSEVWSLEYKVSLGVALQGGRAQVMFLDNNSATGSQKARMHGPGWRTTQVLWMKKVL